MNQCSAQQCTYVHAPEEAVSSLVEKEREIPLLLKFMSHAVRENTALMQTLQNKLACVGRQVHLPEMEDPKPECFTPMGSELKELLIQLKANNQYFAGMLEGLEI